MPRLSPQLIHAAKTIDPLLLPLLKANRTIESSQIELRWIKQELNSSRWNWACRARSKLMPLQYILGSQPFGTLDIKCQKGVLIPRWETEEWCVSLGELINTSLPSLEAELHLKNSLRVLDICSGSGCIGLLLKSMINKPINLIGIDKSNIAIRLSKTNYQRNKLLCDKFGSNASASFIKNDILSPTLDMEHRSFDLITANPPYIPEEAYTSSQTEKSVRLYEPKMALVGGIEFYKSIFFNFVLPTRTGFCICEVGDISQIEETKDIIFNYNKSNKSCWEVGAIYDSAEKPRAVAYWKANSNWKKLSSLCTHIFDH